MSWKREEGKFLRNKSVETGRKISRLMITDTINHYFVRMKSAKTYTGIEMAFNECLGYLKALFFTGAINKKVYDRYFKLLLSMNSRKTLESFDVKRHVW